MRKHQSVFTITIHDGHKLPATQLHMDFNFEILPHIAVGLVDLIHLHVVMATVKSP